MAAVVGLTAVSGGLFAVGANLTGTSPAPIPARSEPAVSPQPHGPMVVPGCLADIECYGESQLILNKPTTQ